LETKQSFSGKGHGIGEEGESGVLEVLVVGGEFLLGAGEAEGTGAALIHAVEDGADTVGAGIGAKPVGGDHAFGEGLERGGESGEVRQEGAAQGIDVDGLGVEVIEEDIDEDAGNAAAGAADASDGGADKGVLVGVAVEFAMEGDTEAELGIGNGVEAAFDEIAEEIAKRDEAGIGKNEKMPEIVHSIQS
jgi:hypothetical protein